MAKDQYNLDSKEKFKEFLRNIQIENIEKSNETIKSDKNLFEEIDNYMEQNFRSAVFLTDEHFYESPIKSQQPVILFGDYQEFKFKIILAKIFYLNQEVIFLKLENLSWINEIKKLKEINSDKDKLLANVSHDLRTPLIGINYNFDQIQPGQDKETVEKIKAQGKANSDLLMSQINDILDYCQMKEQKMKKILTSFNLISVLQETVNLLSIPATLKGISITLKNQILTQNEQIIYSDEKRIKQILINLLSNSVKFTKKGGKIGLVVTAYKHDRIKIEVVDNGAGIKKEIIPQLAQPYATFDNESEMNKHGIGLGLSICKKLIGLLGPTNQLFISSEFGKGSKFGFQIYKQCPEQEIKTTNNSLKQMITSTMLQSKAHLKEPSLLNISDEDESDVFLDLKITEASIDEGIFDIYVTRKAKKNQNLNNNQNNKNNLMLYKNSDQSELLNPKKINILIADDNPFNILVLESYLRNIHELQFCILTASNGQEALKSYKERNYKKSNDNIDMIILDCNMPIMDGFESAMRIKELVENHNFIKADITGYTCSEDDEEKCYQSGMNKFLTKPATEQSFKKFLLNAFINDQL